MVYNLVCYCNSYIHLTENLKKKNTIQIRQRHITLKENIKYYCCELHKQGTPKYLTLDEAIYRFLMKVISYYRFLQERLLFELYLTTLKKIFRLRLRLRPISDWDHLVGESIFTLAPNMFVGP